jgi:hypothetical protein
MVDSPPQDRDATQEDPVYRSSLREAKWILGLWTCCFFYTITYCYLNGYMSHPPLPSSTGPAVTHLAGPLESFNRDPASVSYPLGLGIPDWVFYGVALPWVICIVFSVWFCLAVFVEDDLSAPADGTQEGDE